MERNGLSRTTKITEDRIRKMVKGKVPEAFNRTPGRSVRELEQAKKQGGLRNKR